MTALQLCFSTRLYSEQELRLALSAESEIVIIEEWDNLQLWVCNVVVRNSTDAMLRSIARFFIADLLIADYNDKELTFLPPLCEDLQIENAPHITSIPPLPPKLRFLYIAKCAALRDLPTLPPLLQTVRVNSCPRLHPAQTWRMPFELEIVRLCGTLQDSWAEVVHLAYGSETKVLLSKPGFEPTDATLECRKRCVARRQNVRVLSLALPQEVARHVGAFLEYPH